ncbi:hypothetical protein F5Y09DRAFT_333965 [Xylaria sp. FL1042]|nr:hypothetical protein F5Y09DRAFT_333965 [Xylaria sp. FL1042]
MAKAFFDCHEFQRCAETLLPAGPSDLSMAFRLFLACYALLIQGEKQKTENASQILGPSDTGAVANTQLVKVRSILERWSTLEKDHCGHGSSQGWLEYLYEMVLAKDQNHDLAKLWLLKTLVYYRMKKFELAHSAFSDTLISYPRYLEFLEHYSSILYTLGSGDRLSFVAQLASSVEPYRPETCCVIGNYYSLSSRHQDAIIYFRRALILDRNFSSAWTLLGHEYLKLENSHAAMTSYIRAIGLNNAYEYLEQPKMAPDFYQRAVLLRAGESDIRQAMAGCLRAFACTSSALRRPREYVGDASFRRACLDILFQIARLHDELHNRQEATNFLERFLDEAVEYYSTSNAEKIDFDQQILEAQLLLVCRALV